MTREEEIRKWIDEHYVQVSITAWEDYERIKAEFLQQGKVDVSKLIFGQDGMYGLRDLDDHIVLPAEYDEIRLDYDKEELASPTSIMARKGKWGVVNKDGDVLLPFEFDDILPMDHGEYAVRQRDKWGVYSMLFRKWILPCAHDAVYSHHPSPMALVQVFSDNGKFGWTGCQFPEYDSPAVYDAVYFPRPSYFFSAEYDDDTETFEARIGKAWHTIEAWTAK